MFSWLKRSLGFTGGDDFMLGDSARERGRVPPAYEKEREEAKKRVFCPNVRLGSALSSLGHVFRNAENDDFITRFLSVGGTEAAVVFINGLADRTVLFDAVIRPLQSMYTRPDPDTLVKNGLPVQEAEITEQGETVVNGLLDGKAALMLDGTARVILLDVRRAEKRAVGRTENEKVLYGAHHAFIEDLRTNITLVRSLVRTPDLVTRMMTMGGGNDLRLAVMYKSGTVNPQLVRELMRRLQRAQSKNETFSGGFQLHRFLDQRPFSIFPQTLNTERPDRTATFISQGHLVVLTDGMPFATIAPITIFALLHTREDHNIRPQIAMMMRLIRVLCLLMSMLLPGLYVALMTFHQVSLPTEMMISTLTTRKMIGLSVLGEMLIMVILFELVREASVRVQGSINQTLGIIGGIVLGDALAEASLVSPMALIVVLLAALCGLTIPDYALQMAAYQVRLFFLFASVIGGIIGMTYLSVVLVSYLCTVRSLGVPFFAPVAPATRKNDGMVMRRVNSRTDAPDAINAREDD
ncbi:MAG: spore germination protein [Clostridia bacterium]|nr:spore germination protein [Clostridia bacterium]